MASYLSTIFLPLQLDGPSNALRTRRLRVQVLLGALKSKFHDFPNLAFWGFTIRDVEVMYFPMFFAFGADCESTSSIRGIGQKSYRDFSGDN